MASEKRLIVASELAERVWGIGICFTGLRNGKTLVKEAMEKYRDAVLRAICDAPTVDAVEVVRCKDCIYAAKDDGRQCCNYDTLKQFVDEDFYCASGERRTE